MKKINIVLTVILILSVSISTVYANLNQNSDYIESESIYDEDEMKKIEYQFADLSKKKLKYKYTKSDKNLGATHLTYSDSDDVEYTFDSVTKNLKIIRDTKKFNKKSKKASKVKNFMGKDTIAKNTLKKVVKNSRNYKLVDAKYNEEYKCYKYSWAKFIGGIKSCDEVFIDISLDGEVLCVVIPNEGLFDNNDFEVHKKVNNYISKERALQILDKEVKKSSETRYILDSYEVQESNLYFNKDKRLVWSFLVSTKYKTEGDDDGFVKGVCIEIDANNEEVKYF